MLSVTSTKTCPACGENKGAWDFFRDRTKKSGLSSWCKECKRNGGAPGKIKPPQHHLDSDPKTCSRCKETKKRSDFSSDRSRWDGKHNKCKECDSKKRKLYLDKNRDKVRDYRRKQKQENRQYYREQENRKEKHLQRTSAALATRWGRWSPLEDQTLIELRKTKTRYQCAVALSRSFYSVQSRLDILGKQGRI